jgi:hypothetical protein
MRRHVCECPSFLKARQAADHLGWDERQFLRVRKSGGLPASCVWTDPVSGVRWYRRAALDQWAAGQVAHEEGAA